MEHKLYSKETKTNKSLATFNGPPVDEFHPHFGLEVAASAACGEECEVYLILLLDEKCAAPSLADAEHGLDGAGARPAFF